MIRTVDFNSLATGENVTDQFADIGLRITATSNAPGVDQAMIFDTSNPTGGDDDLATDNLGNVLIISEDGDSTNPDDNETGGVLACGFDDAVTIKSLTFLDLDEPARLFFYGADGALLSEQFVPANGNNGQSVVQLAVSGTTRFEVVLQGSGAVDNLVFEDGTPDVDEPVDPVDPVDPIDPVDPGVRDGIVSGTDDANLIDLGYTGDPEGDLIDAGDAIIAGEAADDDIVDARGGNDTVSAGAADDDIYAGSGDDVVAGGAGNDLIYGDRTLAGGDGPVGTTGDRESFNWSEQGFTNGQSVTGFTQDTGTVNVTFTNVSSTPKTDSTFSTDTQRVTGIEGGSETVSSTSSLAAETRADGQSESYALDFDSPVSNVDFNINEITGDSLVTVRAFDASGNALPVTLVGGGGLTLLDTDGVNGAETADSDGGYADATTPFYSLNVDIAGPVSRIEITHVQNGDGGSNINITDVFFDTGDVVVVGESNDDVLAGDDGNDTIFGETGNDTILGGTGDDLLQGDSGQDYIDGDESNDTINAGPTDENAVNGADAGASGALPASEYDNAYAGGAGDDLINGGAGDDIITGDDDSRVSTETDGVFDLGADGSDTIYGGAGNDEIHTGTWADSDDGFGDTHTGAANDIAFGGDGDDILRGAGGDDTLSGDAGNDNIAGGAGADLLLGGDDADLFIGGTAGDTVDGGTGQTTGLDQDTLDLSGVGDFRLRDVTRDEDGDSDSGTVDFLGADGAVTGSMQFFEIETIIGTPVTENTPPVAVDDELLMDEDTTATINVLTNDTDADGDTLTLIAASSPNGTVEFTPEGLVTFTPNANFNGLSSISYTVTDGNGGTDIGAVDVRIIATPDAPVAVDDAATTPEDTAVVVDLRSNDTDPDDATGTLTISGVSVPVDQGSVVDNGDGTVTFTPAPDFNGEATITYTVTDPIGLSDEGQAIVTVTPANDAPDAVDDADTTDFNTPVTVNLLANDTDIDTPLADLVVSDATVPAEQGTLVNNGDGTVTFTPVTGFAGVATISYTISDGELTDSAVHTVTVGEPLPPQAFDDVASTPEDTAVIIDLRGNDFDPDNTLDELVLSGITVPAEQGTVIDNGDGTVTFTPALNFNGPATITYTITDPTGLSDVAEAVVTVMPVNDAPDAVDDADSTDFNTPVTVNLLANDTDVETPEVIFVTEATVPAEQGTLVNNGDGTVTFTPATEFTGVATISYTISDGDLTDSAVHTVTVSDGVGSGFAPVAVDDTAVTDEETAVTIDVLTNDTDPEDDPLTITEATSNDGTVTITADGQLVFTPNPDFFGEAIIDYTITDGNGGFDDARVFVTVNNINDAPVAVDDSAATDEDTAVTISVLDNDSDVDGDLLTVVAATSEDGTVAINDDGTITFTPNLDFTGDALINYTIEDEEGLQDTAQVTVSVGEASDPPVALDDTAETDEDTPVTIAVLANDSDPDGDPLTVTSATSPEGTVVINDDGTLEFTPNADFDGPATITYTITDGNGGQATATVDVTVNPVNDGPLAEDDSATTEIDTPVTVPVLANDSDPEGDPISVISASSPDGTVVINGDGTLTFTPNAGFIGEAQVNYSITDGALTDPAVLFVQVSDPAGAPVAADDVAETPEDTPVTIPVLANDTDPQGDPLTVTVATSPDGDVVINDDGTLTFTPNPDFNGPTTITYTVADPAGNTDTATVDVTVTPVNDPPVTVDDAAITNQGAPVIIDVLDNDSDPEGDPLTVIAATSPNGDVVINADGTLTFTPAPDFNGPAEITYTVSDGQGGETPGTVNVTVRDGIVTGTDGDDLIDTGYTGDPEGDLVDSGDAFLPGEGPQDDIINAGGGNDTVIAGEGNDDVSGGAGNDSIDGGAGDDELDGDDGNDTLIGGDGNDTVNGGAGNDVIDTSGGAPLPDIGYPGVFPADPNPEDDRDSVDGGDGNDTIRTGDDRDTINGGRGDDVIDAGIDDDVIDGGQGDDRIVGAEGNDSIRGGNGNDTIYANNDPDLGLDALEIEDDGSNPLGPDLAPGNGRDTVDGGSGNDVIFGGDDDDLLMGGSGDDFIDGGIDNDTLTGGTGNDTLIGGQGNDSLEGGQGEDTLEGGIGDDTLRGNRDDDSLHGGDGDDLLDGGAGNDSLTGDAGNDTLEGALGDDTLNGGTGDDSLDGGQGDDILNGDEGNDTLDGALGNDTLFGGDGDDVLNGGSGNDLFEGGAGNDTMTGGADRDVFQNVNAGDIVDGSETGDDFDCLDLRGSAPEGGSLTVNFDPDNAENGVVDYFNADGTDAGQLIFTNIEKVICFTPGTLIATPKGERKVEELQVGDRVITRDNGMQEIRWVGRREMSGEELAAKEHLRPVLIREGALGKGLPERDMMVSPQHRVLIANDKTALYFEEREVLVAAKHLTDMEGIDVVEVSSTSYIHIMFEAHEVILSDGIWTESFQPGDQSLVGIGNAARDEILELFPELATMEGIKAYTAARKSLKKFEAKLLTGKD
ncbi:cadherin-like domain-containing protein [Sulfitobacter guttiformis]|uniref:Ca2+-binding RTX toxin-like protein n=1 Tax=Sulfitobacter guttiformis TaxID=74349 RepID=A0A420DIF2_9RHOB|nr:cadherin-like domain-containing protein [Sulfitobacter guttiformis]KIN72244.1 Type I secretion target repeat protein [Sulfitobacter guttiformis KCTC 32187]RKE93987.1 Ca2+-binding RTX toxin-like protein [Sulfitobacter guttiformis]